MALMFDCVNVVGWGRFKASDRSSGYVLSLPPSTKKHQNEGGISIGISSEQLELQLLTRQAGLVLLAG